MYKFSFNLLLTLLVLLFFGCASLNQPPNTSNVLAKVCQLMDKPIPSTPPNIWVVDNHDKMNDLCAKVDRNSLQKINHGNMILGACIIGDIFLLKNALSESTMAHEMAHYLGADEHEAGRVATFFSQTLVFRPRSFNSDWGRFAINR